MVKNSLKVAVVLALAVVVLANLAVRAEDKKAIPSGTWSKKLSEPKLEFGDKGVLKVMPHGDPAIIVLVCDYTLDKDGLVKAKVTGHEGKDEFKAKVAEKVPVGTEFSFKWMATKDTAKIDNVKCEKFDQIKNHLEGDYELKK